MAVLALVEAPQHFQPLRLPVAVDQAPMVVLAAAVLVAALLAEPVTRRLQVHLKVTMVGMVVQAFPPTIPVVAEAAGVRRQRV